MRLVGSGNAEDRQQHWQIGGISLPPPREAMRRVLVDDARRKHAVKHGGLMRRLDIDVDRLENPKQTDEILKPLMKPWPSCYLTTRPWQNWLTCAISLA